MRSLLFLAAAALCIAVDAPGLHAQPARERMLVGPQSLSLAPGRQDWITVDTYEQTSSSSMHPTTADIGFESSDTTVATVTLDSIRFLRVTARRPGSTQITVRSRRDTNNVVTVAVTVAPAPVGNEAGLVMSASAGLRPTPEDGRTLGPRELDVAVTISNPTLHTRDIWLSGCTAWIRIYRRPDHRDKPLGGVPRGMECGASPIHLVLAPGESREFQAGGYRLTLSPDTLGTGRYYVTALVDRLRDLHEVDAGAVDIVSPNAGLKLNGSIRVAGGQLRTRVTVSNRNKSVVRLEYGACAVTLLAYRSSSMRGTPAWNSDHRQPAGGGMYGCPTYLATVELKPDETQSPGEFNPSFPVAEMLADSLPPGRYFFKARVRLNWRYIEIPAGAAVVR